MSVLSVSSLYDSLCDFSFRIDGLLGLLGLNLNDYQADHIALRVNDPSLAFGLHQQWLTQGDELSLNTINGRPIAVIKLEKALLCGHWNIFCVELPYPSEKHYANEGWEHVEWVIPSRAKTPEAFLDDVLRHFPLLKMRWNTLETMGIKVKLSSPKGEGERIANPSIAFKHKGVCVKLHPVSLEAVIDSEKRRD